MGASLGRLHATCPTCPGAYNQWHTDMEELLESLRSNLSEYQVILSLDLQALTLSEYEEVVKGIRYRDPIITSTEELLEQCTWAGFVRGLGVGSSNSQRNIGKCGVGVGRDPWQPHNVQGGSMAGLIQYRGDKHSREKWDSWGHKYRTPERHILESYQLFAHGVPIKS